MDSECCFDVFQVEEALLAEAIQCCVGENSSSDEVKKINVKFCLVQHMESSDSVEVGFTVSHNGKGVSSHSPQLYMEHIFSGEERGKSHLRPEGSSWRQQVSIITTDVEEDVVRCYSIMFSKSGSIASFAQLPSMPKASYFSGTESSFEAGGCIEDMVYHTVNIMEKIAILRLKVSMELHLQNFSGSTIEHIWAGRETLQDCCDVSDGGNVIIKFNKGAEIQRDISHLDRFRIGVQEDCEHAAASSIEALLSGRDEADVYWAACAGQSGFGAGASDTPWTVECIIAATLSEACLDLDRPQSTRVYVFSERLMDQPDAGFMKLMKTRVNWSRYGLGVSDAVPTSDGYGLLSWEGKGFPGSVDIYFHKYTEGCQMKKLSSQTLAKLLRSATEAALNTLKENQPSLLSSKHQSKVQKCIPDLSRSLAGIVKSSSNTIFQQECLQILGLDSQSLGCLEEELSFRLNTIASQLDDEENFQFSKGRKSGRNADLEDDGEPSFDDNEYVEEMDDMEDMEELENDAEFERRGNNIWDYL